MGTGHNKFFRRGNTYHRVCDGGGGGGGRGSYRQTRKLRLESHCQLSIAG